MKAITNPVDHMLTEIVAPTDSSRTRSGEWGYTTQAGKQELFASIDQAEKDFDDGKAIDGKAVFAELREEVARMRKIK